jgi:hypothetical protein
MASPLQSREPIRRLVVVAILIFAALGARSQALPAKPSCGRTPIHMGNATPLTTSAGLFMVQPPPGWSLDKTHNNPFYFLRPGDTYKKARILMYIHVQRLDFPLMKAVENDNKDFANSCKESRIEELPNPAILEAGCERKAQVFHCDRGNGPWVDLATKISIGGLLVNVVLSADNDAEIAQYKHDYEFLLKHLSLAAQ